MTNNREVFDKKDEEKMGDYGHSRAFSLLPHFADNLEGKKKESNALTDEQEEQQRKEEEALQKEELAKSRKAKVSLARSNITAKSLRKNRDKYDIQRLKKEQMSTYTPFEEDRFCEMVRKAHQR